MGCLVAARRCSCQIVRVPSPSPRFALERTLGRLARWLRLLGFDATLRPDLEPEPLLAQAAREQRVVLLRSRLRDRVRPPRGLQVVGLENDDVRLQIAQLDALLGLLARGQHRPRCTRCNSPLRRLASSASNSVGETVPRGLVLGCSHCHRTFREGPQIERFRVEIRKLREATAARRTRKHIPAAPEIGSVEPG